jgi:alkanesulfonate monooxygenase SsuD/methylene tetrahydromethanopterin reductase-like flavin-dependent oxidoreductase (luciferase family)
MTGTGHQAHRGAVGANRLTFGLSGLVTQADGTTPEAYHAAVRAAVDAAALAEEVGLDAVWTSEHHFSSSGFVPAPFVLLAAMAERTERVTIGTDVMLPSMWDPVRFAEEAAMVDQLSGGRLILALGIGYRDHEFEALGLRRRDRVARFTECIRVLRESVGGTVSGVGLIPDEVLPTSPTPLQPAGPPVWGGGKVEAAVRRARRLGEGYFASMMSPEGLRRRIGWLDDEAPLGDDFALAQTTLAFVAAHGAEEIATPGMRRVQGYMQSWKAESEPGGEDAIREARVATATWRPGDEWQAATPRPDLTDEERLSHALVIGDPAHCVERLTPFVEALADAPGDGPRHLSARLVYPAISPADTAECIRLFAQEVVPPLHEVFTRRKASALRTDKQSTSQSTSQSATAKQAVSQSARRAMADQTQGE